MRTSGTFAVQGTGNCTGLRAPRPSCNAMDCWTQSNGKTEGCRVGTIAPHDQGAGTQAWYDHREAGSPTARGRGLLYLQHARGCKIRFAPRPSLCGNGKIVV